MTKEERLEHIRKRVKEGYWDFPHSDAELLIERIDELEEAIKRIEETLNQLGRELNRNYWEIPRDNPST